MNIERHGHVGAVQEDLIGEFALVPEAAGQCARLAQVLRAQNRRGLEVARVARVMEQAVEHAAAHQVVKAVAAQVVAGDMAVRVDYRIHMSTHEVEVARLSRHAPDMEQRLEQYAVLMRPLRW
ncbi:MAG: hypothetical protein QM803_02150 [Rhodocyclaceae bacterium]